MRPINQIETITLANDFSDFERNNRSHLISIIRSKIPAPDVEDVYQDGLLNLWRATSKTYAERGIKTALGLAVRVMQRQVVNYWKSEKRRLESRPLLIDPPAPEENLEKEKKLKIVNFTPSEKIILWKIGLGMRNDDMAERLHISKNTLRTHIKNIHKKTGIKGRVDLALFASKFLNEEVR